MQQPALTNKPRYHQMPVTREEYLDLIDDGFKYDMINGVLYMSPSASYQHNNVLSEFLYLIKAYLKHNNMAKAVRETDVLLPDGGDVLRPDITVILKKNLTLVKTRIHGAPDMVVEILSPSTKERDLGIKAQRYLENGVKEYFIVNPENETIELWFNQKTTWHKLAQGQLKSQLLMGFNIDPGQFWLEVT